MKRNLISKFFLFAFLLFSFVMVPVACSSDDGGSGTGQEQPEPEPEPEPEADPDPTNENTTIEATEPIHSNGIGTSTVTIQLADADGNLLSTSGGVISISVTGSTTVSEVTDNGDGTYTATVTGDSEEAVVVSGTLDGTSITNTANITFNPDESNPAQEIEQSSEPVGPSIIRINSGGPEVTYDNITFLEDQYFNGPTEAYTNPFVTEIDGTDMDDIFLTERISDNTKVRGPISYNIPVTNGTYTVKLYFAEIYWGSENPEGLQGGDGKRIFNIAMEDTQVFTGYDLHKEHGPASAGTKMYDIEVSDGELTITLEATTNKPKISAIEIFGTGTVGN